MNTKQNSQSRSFERVILGDWEEIVGRLTKVEERDGEFIVHLSSGTIAYPTNSRIADHLNEMLAGHTNERVAILRTNLPEKPVLVSLG